MKPFLVAILGASLMCSVTAQAVAVVDIKHESDRYCVGNDFGDCYIPFVAYGNDLPAVIAVDADIAWYPKGIHVHASCTTVHHTSVKESTGHTLPSQYY